MKINSLGDTYNITTRLYLILLPTISMLGLANGLYHHLQVSH